MLSRECLVDFVRQEDSLGFAERVEGHQPLGPTRIGHQHPERSPELLRLRVRQRRQKTPLHLVGRLIGLPQRNAA